MGSAGGTGTANVLNAGLMTVSGASGDVVLGEGPGSSGTWNVNGAGSRAILEDLNVGAGGSGFRNLGDGNVTVDGVGSTLSIGVTRPDLHWGMVIGGDPNASGGAATMTISGGGSVNSTRGVVIAGNAASTGALTVINSASIANLIDGDAVDDLTVVGRAGDGQLSIRTGGAVQSESGILGQLVGSNGSAQVTDAGSRWNVSRLIVGDRGTAALNVANAGTVQASDKIMIGAFSPNAAATVSGPGSSLHASAVLTVGEGSSAVGMLSVHDGGTVSNFLNAYIASTPNSSGAALIGGAGALAQWSTGGSLFVGGNASTSGGQGSLRLNANGIVNVAEEVKIWANGAVALVAGTGRLELKTLTRTTGSQFDFVAGTLSFLNNAADNRVLDQSSLNDIFNLDAALYAGRTLEIQGPLTLASRLRLDGGKFLVSTLAPGTEQGFRNNLAWTAGTLELRIKSVATGPAAG